jgi:hypothetical protein
VLGAVMLLGGIGLLDLRLLGYARALPLDALSRAVTPLAVGGFGLQVVSGVVLFAADATALAGSAVFLAKMVLILLAGLNVVVFHRLRAPLGPFGRACAAGSLAAWLGVAVLGRLIAYL